MRFTRWFQIWCHISCTPSRSWDMAHFRHLECHGCVKTLLSSHTFYPWHSIGLQVIVRLPRTSALNALTAIINNILFILIIYLYTIYIFIEIYILYTKLLQTFIKKHKYKEYRILTLFILFYSCPHNLSFLYEKSFGTKMENKKKGT